MGWISPKGDSTDSGMGLVVEIPYLADVGTDRFNSAKREPVVWVGSPLGFAVFNAAEILARDAVLNKEGFTLKPLH
jgi:hypothetical protein